MGGSTVGIRRAIIVFPKPGPSLGFLVLEHSFRLPREKQTASEWAEAETAKGRTCRCGCGTKLIVLARHKSTGAPQYVHAHHAMVMAMSKETQGIAAAGRFTAPQVARQLGIGTTTLFRLEGKAYPPVPRQGYRRVRVYTAGDIETIRCWIRANTGLGTGPGLVPLEEVARRAGCAAHTLRRYLGTSLPAGTRILAGSRTRIMFTQDEVEQIVRQFAARKGLSRRLRRGRRALPWEPG